MTLKILNSSNKKIANRFNVQSDNYNNSLNLRVNPLSSQEIIVSLRGNHFGDEDSNS